jgi:hypothetical protein
MEPMTWIGLVLIMYVLGDGELIGAIADRIRGGKK